MTNKKPRSLWRCFQQAWKWELGPAISCGVALGAAFVLLSWAMNHPNLWITPLGFGLMAIGALVVGGGFGFGFYEVSCWLIGPRAVPAPVVPSQSVVETSEKIRTSLLEATQKLTELKAKPRKVRAEIQAEIAALTQLCQRLENKLDKVEVEEIQRDAAKKRAELQKRHFEPDGDGNEGIPSLPPLGRSDEPTPSDP